MADALGRRVNQLIKHYRSWDLQRNRMMTESFDDLMNHFRDNMVGYENEEVLALLKQMEGLVASEALYHGWYGYSGIRPDINKLIAICEQLCNIRYSSHIEKMLLVVTKAEEENFLSNYYRYGVLSPGFCFPLELGKSLQEGGSTHINTYEFLRVLDLESILISLFPPDAVQMVNLRYLAIQAHDGSPHESISNLFNLQMLIISSRKNVVVPKTIWNMVNLRHLYIKSGENLIEEPVFLQVTGKDGCHSPSALASFQTLSQVSPRSCHNIFSWTPNLRKLGFCGPLISTQGDLEFPNLGSLVHLQKLKLLNTFPYPEATRSCNPILFPENLKKLTLSNTGMDWEEMWSFSLLPNLEILKLKFQACIGEIWETGDAEFRQLKVLKLHDLDIKQWVCLRDNFPRLQRVVVQRCLKLDCIPAALGKIFTLEVIEVNGCSLSSYTSAVEIQKEQESEGNNFLKVIGKQNF
ncbi:hypothetical protein L1987_16107 [Smallanthus sonchifolius]|uniref:Uncharacterized protein n=1 Tax=Smallanthus sonchifolius TaxID=185202 RepID=A0ACB9J7T3_9ASTR|nr:hypothetical protein L1987_16107 [Smallanthus sonchifolius]